MKLHNPSSTPRLKQPQDMNNHITMNEPFRQWMLDMLAKGGPQADRLRDYMASNSENYTPRLHHQPLSAIEHTEHVRSVYEHAAVEQSTRHVRSASEHAAVERPTTHVRSAYEHAAVEHPTRHANSTTGTTAVGQSTTQMHLAPAHVPAQTTTETRAYHNETPFSSSNLAERLPRQFPNQLLRRPPSCSQVQPQSVQPYSAQLYPVQSRPTQSHPAQPFRAYNGPPTTQSCILLFPEIAIKTFVFPRLQPQSSNEANHPAQQHLVTETHKLAPAQTLPHVFLDKLTIAHNNAFHSPVARIYDVLFMQTLLFDGDRVLLVSPKHDETKLETWELPQSVWHAYELPSISNQPIGVHAFVALHRITSLLPDEIVRCEPVRHDSAVNLLQSNGGTVFAWSTALCYEIKLDIPKPVLRNQTPDLKMAWFTARQVQTLNMCQVWKDKVLDVFAQRLKAEQELYNFGKSTMWTV